MKHLFFALLILPLIIGCAETPEQTGATEDSLPEVKWIGAMKNVMHSGDLTGKIWLDSINRKEHLYGLGPTEGLEKEIMVLDGNPFVSAVVDDSTIKVVENSDVKAPFFVYTYADSWKGETTPDSIATIAQIESFLDHKAVDIDKPFLFKVTGVVDSAVIHIVNLAKGSEVHGPEDAHKDLKQFPVVNEEVEIIGFFSRKHQAVFIHHDAYTHMHLVTSDRQKMGHLDYVALKKGTVQLFIPANR